MAKKSAAAEVFISHSSKNAAFAKRLVQLLNTNSIPSFYSKTSIQGAKQWHDEIGAALGRCKWFLLILSPDSVTSRWVKHELLFALDQERYQDRIIPVIYRKCDQAKLSWTLSSFESIDFRKSFAVASAELLKVFGK
jgi:hypothetical protein